MANYGVRGAGSRSLSIRTSKCDVVVIICRLIAAVVALGFCRVRARVAGSAVIPRLHSARIVCLLAQLPLGRPDATGFN
jgi:hypothetical protein